MEKLAKTSLNETEEVYSYGRFIENRNEFDPLIIRRSLATRDLLNDMNIH